jgi:hypothetical protein
MSIDRGAIDEQLRSIGESERWWEQREFRDLPHILHPGEKLRGLVNGRVIGRRLPLPRVLPAAMWLIAVTDERLICLKQQRFGRKEIDVPRAHIFGMKHRTRIFAAQITLETVDRRIRLRVAKADAFRFVGALSALMPRPIPAAGGSAHIAYSGVLMPGLQGLSAADLVTRGDLGRLEATVERLEADVERLQQQVDFLENLLQKRAAGAGDLALPAMRE